jgi:hypothetical protein
MTEVTGFPASLAKRSSSIFFSCPRQAEAVTSEKKMNAVILQMSLRDNFIDEAQEHGERHDDWGTGYFAEAGYEFWISSNATAGLIASYNYFDIDGDIVKNAWFTSANLTLSLYF